MGYDLEIMQLPSKEERLTNGDLTQGGDDIEYWLDECENIAQTYPE